jgi:hypothetical protein
MSPALLPFSSMYANGSIHLVVSLSSFTGLDRGYVLIERERGGGVQWNNRAIYSLDTGSAVRTTLLSHTFKQGQKAQIRGPHCYC